MRNVGYEFLSGFIQNTHTCDHIVEGMNNILRFKIIIDLNTGCRIPGLNILDCLCQLLKGTNQKGRRQNRHGKNNNHHKQHQKIGFSPEDLQRCRNRVR